VRRDPAATGGAAGKMRLGCCGWEAAVRVGNPNRHPLILQRRGTNGPVVGPGEHAGRRAAGWAGRQQQLLGQAIAQADGPLAWPAASNGCWATFVFIYFILFPLFCLEISSSLYFSSWILVYVNYCCLSLFNHVALLSLDLSCDAYVQMCFITYVLRNFDINVSMFVYILSLSYLISLLLYFITYIISLL
jgi:hypothetical protein